MKLLKKLLEDMTGTHIHKYLLSVHDLIYNFSDK